MTQVYKPSQILSVQREFLHILVDLCKHPRDQDIEHSSNLKPLPSHDLPPEITTVLTSWHFLLYCFPSICHSPSSISSHSHTFYLSVGFVHVSDSLSANFNSSAFKILPFLACCVSTVLVQPHGHSAGPVHSPPSPSPPGFGPHPQLPIADLPYYDSQVFHGCVLPLTTLAASSLFLCSLYTGPTYTRHGPASGSLHLPSSFSGILFSGCPCDWLLSPLELCFNSPPP